MIFPLEILEHILLKCDGKTLLTARKSCKSLRDTIDYLTEKTRLWEWCCREEINPEELVEYLPKYEAYGKEKWLYMYINWSSWETIEDVTILNPILSPVQFQKISSIAVSSDHIAVGSEDGRLRIFTKHWAPVFEHRIVAVKLTKLTFIDYNDYNDINNLDLCLVVAYPKGISIVAFNGIRNYQFDILDIISHSVYNNYICYEKVGGRMTIIKITNHYDRREIQEIWFTRIYSPGCITCYKMWNGKCTFLINSILESLVYENPNITPMEQMQRITDIKFYAPLIIDSSTTQILRDNVIISVYKNNGSDKTSQPDIIEDYVEIIIIDKYKRHSKKLFNMWEIFRSNITCIFLYGNTLLIGTDSGSLYYYHISNWKNFDLKYYNHRQVICKHPIIVIQAKENEKERKFYICSKFTVHEVSGFIPSIY
ncbi:uncharacterized protein LOC115883240 [Sitophilus oryzae]|uniref:Uncharacterized protein LOC115883240 n=1 Tax=Sitophilus oryzae TaxID=7048 RepID=A0A6J2Y158_SITOR|nr:uncharacterized protein LOC115883240 [Sitophilus oryzae]